MNTGLARVVIPEGCVELHTAIQQGLVQLLELLLEVLGALGTKQIVSDQHGRVVFEAVTQCLSMASGRVLDSISMGARRAAAAAVLAICLGAPTIELFESWDPPSARGSDTELSAVLVALCVGATIVAAGTLAAKLFHLGVSGTTPQPAVASPRVSVLSLLTTVPVPCTRPPTLLRI